MQGLIGTEFSTAQPPRISCFARLQGDLHISMDKHVLSMYFIYLVLEWSRRVVDTFIGARAPYIFGKDPRPRALHTPVWRYPWYPKLKETPRLTVSQPNNRLDISYLNFIHWSNIVAHNDCVSILSNLFIINCLFFLSYIRFIFLRHSWAWLFFFTRLNNIIHYGWSKRGSLKLRLTDCYLKLSINFYAGFFFVKQDLFHNLQLNIRTTT